MPDLCIVGAGPVGATFALALADAELDVVVLDARAEGEPPRGERSIALSHGGRLILERAGVWCALTASAGAVTPIVTIDVSQAGGFGLTRLDAAEQGVPALGYVVSYTALQRALDERIRERRIHVRWGARATRVAATSVYATAALDGGDDVIARLAVVADGTGSAIDGVARQRVDYAQSAIVSRLDLAAPHRGVACERFTPQGPIALLPEGDRYGLVWTVASERARELLALTDDAFLAALKSAFGPRASSLVRAADRRAFPLVLEVALAPWNGRAVAIGNAAQTLHPVAAQGVNLGLRDAYALARIALDTPREAIGSASMLRRYARARLADRIAGIAFTHSLVRGFAGDSALVRAPRGVALALLDAVAPLKSAFTHAMLHGVR